MSFSRILFFLSATLVVPLRSPSALGVGDDTCATATVVTNGVYAGLQTAGAWAFPTNITFDSDWFRFTALPGQRVDVDALVTTTSGQITAGYYTFMSLFEFSPTVCSGSGLATSFSNHVSVVNPTTTPKDYVLRYYAGVNAAGDHVVVTYDLSVQAAVTGQSFCSGDGAGASCPCANNGVAGHGCANSGSNAGARLVAIGNAGASLGNDTLSLIATNITGPALFFQGDGQVAGAGGVAFGDGLLCAGGAIVRLGVVFPTGTTASYPGALTPIHVTGAASGGDVRFYQCWYRDAAAFCTSATHNSSNGWSVTWGV